MKRRELQRVPIIVVLPRMSEVSDAFRRIERPNVRTNTSVQPFHCALRSFAQPCLQWMEQQLYRVKVRRIRRQVAEACTNSLDRLLHTSDFVERDVVDHHNISALERWDQTLLYVSQEGLSIHGSFDQHRSHDAGLPQPSINVTVSQCPIGASLTKRSPRGFQPLSRSMLVVTAVSSINTRRPIKKALLPNPASARAGDVGALPLCRPQTFF